jgi:ABC-type siderophore export system fused ATPase/permease subunit
MKTTDQTQARVRAASNPSFKKVCEAYCRKLLAEMKQTKEKLFTQFQDRLNGQKDVLRLALNEAEAQLLFPELATEKAQAAVAWEHRQRTLKGSRSNLAFA